MRLDQVAAQLYTVRDFVKTTSDFDASMKKIKAIGYDAVQLSGLGPIPTSELVRILKDHGLYCCVIHEPGDIILNQPEKIMEKLATLECPYIGYPYPSGVPLDTLEQVKDFAEKLEKAGRFFQENGATLVYHNHHLEFRRIKHKPILDILFEETQPPFLQGEIDTYWVQYGGGDPIAWCRKLESRLPILHMKDYKINSEGAPDFAEIGNGNLDWKGIIKAAQDSGCKWFIVEQDTCPEDPFDSLKISYDFIREKLVCT